MQAKYYAVKPEIIREKINTLKCWPVSRDSADAAFLCGVAKDLEKLLVEREEQILVLRGKWQKAWNDCICSVCGCSAPYSYKSSVQNMSRFCPSCGAKMGNW